MMLDMNALKAEFWLCLSRAFLPPMTEAAQNALRENLADDLAEIASELGYPVIPQIDDYRKAIAGFDDGQELLALYSRLFLIPGVAHPHINTGAYLDGSLAGGTVRQLAECYRSCGLEKSESLSDLPDHAAVQLEFAAWLFASQAEAGHPSRSLTLTAAEFISAFIARWALSFRRDLELASARLELAGNPWLPLAHILESIAQIESVSSGMDKPVEEEDEITRLRRQYAGRLPEVADLAKIRASLSANGLASDHVGLPPQARDAAAGLSSLSPPQPPRHILPGK
jgi:TorA maturation chaperone TorD